MSNSAPDNLDLCSRSRILSDPWDRLAVVGISDEFGHEVDDDEWDRLADAELTALAEAEAEAAAALAAAPRSRPRWERPFRWPSPARVYDRQLAVLDADGVGEFLRACRASAGLSQRDVAASVGMPQQTVAKIEAGRSPGVTVATIARLAGACDVILVGTTGSHAPMIESDLAQRHRDRAGRLLQAHLINSPRPRPQEVSFPEHNDRPHTPRCYDRRRLRDVPDD